MAETGELEWEMFEHPLPNGQVGRIKGWLQDPYDPNYAGLTTRSIADDEEYDALLPRHPLSKARRMLRNVATSFSVDE